MSSSGPSSDVKPYAFLPDATADSMALRSSDRRVSVAGSFHLDASCVVTASCISMNRLPAFGIISLLLDGMGAIASSR